MNEHSELMNQKVKNELKPGEIISWSGQPDPSQFSKSTWVSTLFFIPWTAFSIFWMAGASGFEIPDFSKGGFEFFPFFGLPFLFIGIWGLTLPLRAKRNAQSVIYVITNKRAIIIEGNKSISYKSFYPDQIQHIEKVINNDNSGCLYFSEESYRDSDGDKRIKKNGFIGISDVNTVEEKLKTLIKRGA